MSIVKKMKFAGWLFLSLPLFALLAFLFNSHFLGGILGAGAGSFTFNDPIILIFCIALGACWSGNTRNLALTLIVTNLVYRTWLFAFALPKQYAAMGEHYTINLERIVLVMVASSYFALLIGFAVFKSVNYLRAELRRSHHGES